MFKIFTHIYWIILCIFICAMPAQASQIWEEIEPGLELAYFPIADNVNTSVTVLRINPDFFEFSVQSISVNNNSAKTLMQWAVEHDFVAAINASMYLPDGKTSTGYMKVGTHYNNKHIAKNFGAFFISKPLDSKLAQARVIDKDTKGWEDLIAQYGDVVQNYRLINSQREVLWSVSGQMHSIAAVAEDDNGKILFLHCREPIKAHDFAVALLDLPLNVRTVMYVEGGVQAGLVLRNKGEEIIFGGRHPSNIFMDGVSVALPNIIGVLRKQHADAK